VVYAHACPNQHLLPLLAWALPRLGRRVVLTGSNYIWGWEMNRVAREVVGRAGGEVLAERHLPLGDVGLGRLVEEVRATRPSFVLNNLVGQSSYAFLAAMARQGVPILSCNLTECELPVLGEAAEGLVSAGPHFGATSSFEEAARAAVLTLAARVSRGGDATLPELLARPGGPLAIDPATHHAALPVVLARVEGGAFAPFERQAAVAPDPYLSRRAPQPGPRLRAVAS
jgi:branched-chain amino acid transport system substrate-binding protein